MTLKTVEWKCLMSGRPVQSDLPSTWSHLPKRLTSSVNPWLFCCLGRLVWAELECLDLEESQSARLSSSSHHTTALISTSDSNQSQMCLCGRYWGESNKGEDEGQNGKKEQLEEWKVEKRLDSIDERRLDKTRLEGKRWRKQRGGTRLGPGERRRLIQKSDEEDEGWKRRKQTPGKEGWRRRVMERLEGRERRKGNPRVSELLEWKIRACFYQIVGHKFSLCGPVESEPKTLW